MNEIDKMEQELPVINQQVIQEVLREAGYKTEIVVTRFGYRYVFVGSKRRPVFDWEIANVFAHTILNGRVEIKQLNSLVAVYVPGDKE